MLEATTGHPAAIASRITNGVVSIREGTTRQIKKTHQRRRIGAGAHQSNDFPQSPRGDHLLDRRAILALADDPDPHRRQARGIPQDLEGIQEMAMSLARGEAADDPEDERTAGGAGARAELLLHPPRQRSGSSTP